MRCGRSLLRAGNATESGDKKSSAHETAKALQQGIIQTSEAASLQAAPTAQHNFELLRSSCAM